jgi:mono/diheme cytochrome c family protein
VPVISASSRFVVSVWPLDNPMTLLRFRSTHFAWLLIAIGLTSSSLAAPPAAQWEFSTEESTPLIAKGGVHRDAPGPRPPEFPDFEPMNLAVQLDGLGAHYEFADSGEKSPFDFSNGDEMTLEAWVKVDDLRSGENLYVIGKGRTGAAPFARDNQNWALRVRGVAGKACVSFLFATPPSPGVDKSDAHWHRWTTTAGFDPKTGWHHIAAAYRFGSPETIRGWIDGLPQQGSWDMGGATKSAPVVDDDAVWIGSAQGGAAGNSFRGMLDSIAVHRAMLDDKVMAAKFKRTGGSILVLPASESLAELGPLPTDRVIAMFHEGAPAHNRWLNEGESWSAETTQWEGEEFLLPRLPLRYDAWGIRESWKPSVLVRIAADVALPAGKNTLLLRARGLSRLWVDGRIVARTKPLTGSPSGEEPITPIAAPPLPGLRAASHRLQEEIVEIDVGPGEYHRVVVETMAGGKGHRPEPGELIVARRTDDGKSYVVLRPYGAATAPTPLTDSEVERSLLRIEASLAALDDRTRRSAAAAQDPFWKHRHEAARVWAAEHPVPGAPKSGTPRATDVAHPIDAFLVAKIERAKALAAETPHELSEHFHTKVLPILRSECFRCHGDKVQGGLQLNRREAALKGGDSGLPAIAVDKPEESELLRRVRSTTEGERMPPTGKGLSSEQTATLRQWIKSGAPWPAAPLAPEQTALAPRIDDAAFLRRAYLDTVGVPPTSVDVRAFVADVDPNKRTRLIDRLLADDRWADHWMGYWQDVLAENPTLINQTLNNTGPFRWFLYDALRDDKPLDRLVTELIMLRGGQHDGGSAGFGLAAQNDAPMAAKAHIIATAFLGVDMQCARCHDSPYHSTKQRDLYAISAMFSRKSVTVPKTSSVPAAFFENKARESLIRVTLKPGEAIGPAWPFGELTGLNEENLPDDLLSDPTDVRERLAALITAPQNVRFSRVIVNRVWRRLMGAGIVEPAHDWEGRTASHGELLDWLAREFTAHDFSIKHVARLILTSQAYGRAALGKNLAAEPELRFFNAPEPRRLTAEQIVDSFFASSGGAIDVEVLTLDPDGRRPASNRNTYGRPRRAWMYISLSNERDRPSLTLPRAAVVVEVLEAFGWSAARQTPRTDRETAVSVLQPGAVANSTLSLWLTRAAHGSPLADLACEATDPGELVNEIFLRFLSRLPTSEEREPLIATLHQGFANRLVRPEEVDLPAPHEPLPQVTWSNHLRSEANVIQQEWERRMRAGPPPDPRLQPTWRETFEDVVWSVVNLREFVWMP